VRQHRRLDLRVNPLTAKKLPGKHRSSTDAGRRDIFE